MSSATFESLNLHPSIMRAVEEAGYTTPTPIQAQAIPEVMAGKDLMASAQTGTGKTAGFTLPALNLLATPHELKSRGPRILVLVPTRELAAQVNDSARKYGKYLRARTVSIVGGMPYPLQNKLLSQPLDILVATPGRFIDHMERGRIDLSRLQMFVLDEADRMLDMGFMPDVERICKALPAERQTLLFSATLDGNIGRIARDILRDPITIKIAAQKEKHANIEQRLHFVDDMSHKNKLLEHLLIGPDVNQTIIFTSTKRHADVLAEDLYAAGHKTAALHGDMTQGARNRTLTKLRHGDVKVLVATDVAARGIDVQGISHVVNYDLPKFAEDYVHRIGRTGRAGNTGTAISFASGADRHLLRKIEQFTGQRIEPTQIEGLEPKRPIKVDAPDSKRGRNRNSKPRNGGGYKTSNRNGSRNSRNDNDRQHNGAGRNKQHQKPSQRNQHNGQALQRDESTGEVNGNSVNYTKDTDMQFARELSRGFVDGRQVQKKTNRKPKNNANKRSDGISSEKFGNPRPKRNFSGNGNAKPAGNQSPRRKNNDNAKRSRDFA